KSKPAYANWVNMIESILSKEELMVTDSDGHIFIFPSFMLNKGATIRINTNKGGFSFKTPDSVWDRVGEPAYLKDSAGRLVDIYSY
ncbi:hypothetical protein MEO41_28300, partial [Dolichospermum sp. ST_sed4]|nr:hypothetical protein [Dolichospermum sp. ST_sed4]